MAAAESDVAQVPARPTGDRTASAGDPTLVVEDVHVVYRVYKDRKPSLREMVTRGVRQREATEIHAVRGVSFTSYAGEAIGVIGSNGSGKSTLLRALAGLLPVTSGQVWARSEPALLGVGAALQPQLSGRRNIQLGGLALGLSREEVDAKLDDIIEFSGLRDSIDLPLKTYSSGMKARLHFALATSVQPEVLLIDEALAVGDKEFRKRSEERIAELISGAGTVFVVSHNMKSITNVCSRALWLEEGEVRADGAPNDVVAAYGDAE